MEVIGLDLGNPRRSAAGLGGTGRNSDCSRGQGNPNQKSRVLFHDAMRELVVSFDKDAAISWEDGRFLRKIEPFSRF
jgi:hypothetical protein